MNFTFSWIMDKLGYMPKIDMKVGELAKAWPFPVEQENVKKQGKKPVVAKATTRKAKAPAKKK